MSGSEPSRTSDPFLVKYKPSELQIAAEFFTDWLPFLTRDLCPGCTRNISRRVRSLDPGSSGNAESLELGEGFGDSTPAHAERSHANQDNSNSDTNLLGSWKDSVNGWSAPVPDVSRSPVSEAGILQTPSVRMSWADMAQEDELEEEVEELQDEGESETDKLDLVVEVQPDGRKVVKKPAVLPREQRELIRFKNVQRKKDFICLPMEQRELIRFKNVQRKKDFICLERVKGKIVNILDGLELHKGVFSAAEQEKIVNLVYDLQEKGRKGELREHTYTAPRKWMPGKGRVTIQFGCCYNYAIDKDRNPPGILRNVQVDRMPHLFKVIIRRLIGWHVLPPSCVPDSCIVNIYDEGDCIPPHIDNHDFVRPFCTISFLTECNIVFGSNLAIVGPGQFSGATAIPLPVGSVLVLNGNGADVAKHCVPAVPTKRISITFRKMDEAKRPFNFVPEPDLQGLQPLLYEVDDSNTPIIKSAPQLNQTPIIRSGPLPNRQPIIRDVQPIIRDRDSERPRRGFRGREGNHRSAPRQFDGNQSHPPYWQRMKINVDLE